MKRRTRRNPQQDGPFSLLHEDPETKETILEGRTNDLHAAVDEALRRASMWHDYFVQGRLDGQHFSIQIRRFR